MPGAGKSTVATALSKCGFVVVTMGDCVREESIKRGLDPTDENLGKLMLDLRKEDGPAAIANLVAKKISKIYSEQNKSKFVVDGIRSNSEIDLLKEIGVVKIIGIHASTPIRFRHLKERSRTDAPSTMKDCELRDQRELEVGVSKAIALADEIIPNNDITVDELISKAQKIIKKWTNSF